MDFPDLVDTLVWPLKQPLPSRRDQPYRPAGRVEGVVFGAAAMSRQEHKNYFFVIGSFLEVLKELFYGLPFFPGKTISLTPVTSPFDSGSRERSITNPAGFWVVTGSVISISLRVTKVPSTWNSSD